MLTDPGQILKIEGALDKLTDAVQKLCDVTTDQTAPPDDRVFIRRCIKEISSAKIALSTVLIPTPLPPG